MHGADGAGATTVSGDGGGERGATQTEEGRSAEGRSRSGFRAINTSQQPRSPAREADLFCPITSRADMGCSTSVNAPEKKRQGTSSKRAPVRALALLDDMYDDGDIDAPDRLCHNVNLTASCPPGRGSFGKPRCITDAF
jgi:hypothetical protein